MSNGVKSFFSDLRKKRIIEILAAFIGGGWLIYEIVERVLVMHYKFPEKLLDITIVTLIAALICTLLWRWFYNREKPRKFKLELVLILLVVLVTVLLDINLLLHLKAPEPETIPASKWKNSIAVLPFVDMSPQKDQEYFCDGITDEIIGRLSNISELKVPARTSVFYFKGKDQDIKEIGHKLGVAAVLEGSIQKVETKLRARVQLINIADGFHVWSEEFDRELKDVFAIQDEIALAVADKLKLTLLGDEKAKLAKHHEIDPRAYDAHLKGLYYWWQWSESEEVNTNALQYFRRAIEIEPNYARAHAGVALTYVTASTWIGLWPARESMPKAKEAAERAIQLDPTLADGYVARGLARMYLDWDWAGAETDLKRAIELSPNSTLALDGYASFLVPKGRFEESAAVMKKALELDPLSAALHNDLGWTYWVAGQFDRAIPHYLRALELDRNLHGSRRCLGFSYLFTGKTAEALAEFETAEQLAQDSPWNQAVLGFAYGYTGRRTEALQALANLDQLAQKRLVPPCVRAWVYAGLGQKDAALDWLEKAFEERDGWIISMVEPQLASLRSEPRFQALLKKMGLGK